MHPLFRSCLKPAVGEGPTRAAPVIRAYDGLRSNYGPGPASMLSYKDLADHYVASEGRRLAHWRRLQDAAAMLIDALEVSLMLESPTWMDDGGEVHRYVSLGAVRDGRFEVVDASALPGTDDLALTFAIRLSLQRSPDAMPTQAFLVPLELRQWDLLFEVEIVCKSKPQFAIPVESGPEGYADAAEGIKQWISLSLKQYHAAGITMLRGPHRRCLATDTSSVGQVGK